MFAHKLSKRSPGHTQLIWPLSPHLLYKCWQNKTLFSETAMLYNNVYIFAMKIFISESSGAVEKPNTD